MNSQLREKAIQFRVKDELSYSEIKSRLQVSKSTLSYWLRDFPLSDEKILELRRKNWTKGEASRERFRVSMRKKKEVLAKQTYDKYRQKFKRISKETFFAAGLMLYLGEGAKKKESSIVLANTDTKVIRFFVRWLIEFLGIPKIKMRAQLHLYENMDINDEKIFWEKELGFLPQQFYKVSIRTLKPNSFSYKSSFNHGTCSLYAFGADKYRELMMAVKAFVDVYLE